MPFPICDPCKVRKNCAGKGFIEGSIVQCLMVSAISYTQKKLHIRRPRHHGQLPFCTAENHSNLRFSLSGARIPVTLVVGGIAPSLPFCNIICCDF